MSHSGCASTARDEPSETDIRKRKPRSISTTVWFTAPPSKMRDAPAVSEVRPDATAASWSARSRGNPSDIARRSPSAETTTVCDTPGVLSTKLVINQFRFCAAWLIGLTLTLLVVGAVRAEALTVRIAAGIAAPLDTATQIAQPAPDVLGSTGDRWAPLRGGFGGSLDQVGLGHPPRQTGGGDPARLGLPELGGLLPPRVVGRAPGFAAAVALRRGGRRLLVRVPRAVRAVGAAPGGATAGEPGVGQLVTHGGGGRPRTFEAYSVALTHVSGLHRFRFRSVLVRVAVLVTLRLRPVILVAALLESREGLRCGRVHRRGLLLDRLRIGGFRVAAVGGEGVVLRQAAVLRVVRLVVRRALRLLVGRLPLLLLRRLLRLLVRRLLVVRGGLLLREAGPAVVVTGLRGALGSVERVGVRRVRTLESGRLAVLGLQGRATLLAHQGAAHRVQLAYVVRDLG